MDDKEKTEHATMAIWGMEFQSLHNCAGQILANPKAYPEELQEPAKQYLLDVFRRATIGKLN